MPDGPSYLVLGAGAQGVAAAHDLCLHGGAAGLTLADADSKAVAAGLARLRKVSKGLRLSGARLDAKNPAALKKLFRGRQGVLSALPFYLNPAVARQAVAARVHYVDLGGHFDTTQVLLKLDKAARKAGVALVPDCGVAPGLCNTLAAFGMSHLDNTRDVYLYCGGLPQHPRPPLNYSIVFNLEGLLGNYFGKAHVLEKGVLAVAPPLSGLEVRDFPGVGTLEAAVTGGATSTAPWTFRGRVRTYVYKTLRYPGHFEKIRTLAALGLLDTAPVSVKGLKVVPRDLFVAVAGPRLKAEDPRDLLALQAVLRGEKDGRLVEIVYDLLDHYDPATGFTAMQRTTGFSAAIILAMLADGRITDRGAVPVESGVPPAAFLEEIRRRGINVRETLRELAPARTP